jgi:2-oxo-4-hydroxy-4-carboxy-5-ureidoimidazoline decarboxylase
LSEGVGGFNALSDQAVREHLQECFANQAWASQVAAGRPYPDLDALLASAESGWSELEASAWLAAIASHPRIGEPGGHSPGASEREQRAAMQARPETLAALAAENRGYEARFGYVFLIAASGRTAEQILDSLRRRMANDPSVELEVASGELRKIARLRLEWLVKGSASR